MSKRLVLCCDGTWNTADQKRDGQPCPSNVTKVALGLARDDGAGVEQRVYYQQGVGTQPGERLRGGALGRCHQGQRPSGRGSAVRPRASHPLR